ncbi:hypothetical protein K431DRAFT_59632 [Polychaeton citri CBS 116435]|uniref:Phosphatidic acid phosphatase type 2/haloperoxidase domain-containing protein n=1 Tax=Polychaeton citri CBS 116435 TaxID=1314669 RepID=A0A9P4UPR5_9PEZI|nr:hypothetical protein K431DRAFT_59632 [Polychaeton citri CBS 116435]
MHGKGYGMPSSHAQFVAFFSTFLTLFLLLRHSPHPHPPPSYSSSAASSSPPPTPPTPYSHRLLLSFAAFLSAAAVAQSRIYLNYHTPKQVYAGVGAGVAFAIFWFIFTEIVRKSGLLAWGLDLRISRALRVRDLVVEEDIWEAGWERFEIRRMRKRRDIKAKGQ